MSTIDSTEHPDPNEARSGTQRTHRGQAAFGGVRAITWVAAMLLSGLLWPSALRAQELAPPTTRPYASNSHFLQYGIALVSENVVSVADICPANAAVPCIIGPGIGATIRMGYRARGPWYVGGAYEFTHHQSSNLLRLAILQQIRAEIRYYLDQGTRLSPYLSAGPGMVIYGNEWGVESAGPSLNAGIGFEYQAGDAAVVGLGINWHGFGLRKWTDGAGQARADERLGFGLGQLIALEFTFELRNPLPRW